MSGQGRLGDKARAPLDAHGCPACPHPAIGPAVGGSPDVSVNGRPALRVDDPGIHSACCAGNTWTATTGSTTVFINGKSAHRIGDQTSHCGGNGELVEGSPNVVVESGATSGDGSRPKRVVSPQPQLITGSVATEASGTNAAAPRGIVFTSAASTGATAPTGGASPIAGATPTSAAAPEPVLQIVSVDGHFAPGIESMKVAYNIVKLASRRVVVRITSDSYPSSLLFERELTAAEKQDGAHTLAWNGHATANAGPLAGLFINPAFSPYRCELVSGSLSDARSFRVIVDSIQLTTGDANGRYIMDEPAIQTFDVFATVLVRSIADTGVATPCPIKVAFTFIDPEPQNATDANSFVPPGGAALGKQGSTTERFWRRSIGWNATSDDSFKASAKVDVSTHAGTGQGKAKILFRPGGCGGDDYTLRAEVFAADEITSLAVRTSPTLTVFRSVTFRAFQMTGQTQLATHGSEAIMAKFFVPETFVEYHLGEITTIAAKFSVAYIGLWDHTAQAMGDWDAIQAKTHHETPTALETNDANGPPGPQQVTARAKIQAKVNAWRDRIVAAADGGINNWPLDAGVPTNAMVAAILDHPKLSAAAPNDDAETAQWTDFPWLRIATARGSVHPDTRWHLAQSVTMGSRVYFMSGMSPARAERALAHEVGHASRSQFPREKFGPGDHTDPGIRGLMDPTASRHAFTAAEIKILRGIH